MVAAWIVSLVLHTAAILGMFLLVFPFSDSATKPPPLVDAQIVGDIDAAPSAAMHSPDLLPSPQTETSAVRFTPQANEAAEALERFRRPAAMKEPELPIIGIGDGGGEAGDLSKSGLSPAGGAAPEFFGAGGSVRGVRSVIYVVDRSGSMADTFNRVRAELKRSISSLRRSQKFHVILFNSGPPLESPPFRLVNATAASRKAFFEFLETVDPAGSTHPENALRRALSLGPDLIYLLSDGINFDPALPGKLGEWNQDRRTRIFTIAYLDPGGREMLESIAREHRGEFKFVSEYDLP